MYKKQTQWTAFPRLLRDRHGNFAIVTAIALPMLLGVVSMAIDIGSIVDVHNDLQAAVDSASLAAAASMSSGKTDTTSVQAYTKAFLAGQMANYLTAAELTELKAGMAVTATQTITANAKVYNVTVKAAFTKPLSGLATMVGYTTSKITASSATQSQAESKNAMSMYLVLDRSGSMSWVTDTVFSTTTKCQNYTASNWSTYPNATKTKPCYVNKISALKTAAESLFDQLDAAEAADTSNTLIRVGTVSFTDEVQDPEPLAWGTTAVRNYVTALPAYPSGGTDMTSPMTIAYNALRASAETTAQATKSNTTFTKYIVLMTDGENTGASATWNPLLDTKTLLTCTAARTAGITIYTVAFMAPVNGKALLQSCSGSSANSYEADDMDSLVAAFKAIGEKASKQSTRLTN